MNEDQLKLYLNDKKKKRGLGWNQKRHFICPCGKNFVTYCGMMIHIRVKHDGLAPGDIKKPIPEPWRPKARFKRGKSVLCRKIKQLSQKYTNMEFFYGDDEENSLNNFCEHINSEKSQPQLRQEMKDFYTRDPFYQTYIHFDPMLLNPQYNSKEDLFDETCENALCEFLAEVINTLENPFHWDVAFLFVLLIVRVTRQKLENDDALQQERARNLANYINDIYLLLPQWTILPCIQNLKIFKSWRITKLLENFSSWLVKKKYTSLKAKMNSRYFG